MPFKEQIATDIKNVFLNFSELADWHKIEYKDVLCIVDDDTLQQHKIKNAPGNYAGKKLIHVARADLKGRPAVDARLLFDGKTYTVKDCIDNEGILSITLDIIKA